MRANAATMSRRRMLTTMPAAVAITGDTAAATADDPVFAAIERHCQAVQALHQTIKPARRCQYRPALQAEGDALLPWVTTPPTTLAGVLATLEHAVVKSGDPDDPRYSRSEDLTNLFEGAEMPHEAFEQFPA